MRVLILADHAYRDVAGHCSVAVELERLGHEALVADIHLFPQLAESFKPHLTVINHLHDPGRNKIVDTLRRRGGLCAVMPSEGRPNTNAQLEWAGKKFDTSLCDLYLSWSVEFTKYLDVSIHSVVTGCPRFDFHFSNLRPKEIIGKYQLDIERPIITVASSYPQAKFAWLGTDFLESDWKKLRVTEIRGFEKPSEVALDERKRFERFQSWILSLRNEYPEFQVLVKPHPAEDIRPWLKLGVKVILCDFITDILSISDLHVARVGCLTVPEAWVAGVQTVQVADMKVDGPAEDAKLGFVANSVGEFMEQVENGLVGDPDDRTDYVQKWLGPMPGSSKRVADAIHGLLTEKNPKFFFDYTLQDRLAVNQLLYAHDKQHSSPTMDNVAQFAKTVIKTQVDYWMEELR